MRSKRVITVGYYILIRLITNFQRNPALKKVPVNVFGQELCWNELELPSTQILLSPFCIPVAQKIYSDLRPEILNFHVTFDRVLEVFRKFERHKCAIPVFKCKQNFVLAIYFELSPIHHS